MDIIFATSNPNKISEVRKLLGSDSEILGLSDINWTEPIEETATTLEGNAMIKALTVANKLEVDCFAEDTGLEIDALDGRPGVYSARYAGEDNNASGNMRMVLEELHGQENRGAQFRTIISLVMDGALHHFEGIVRGKIAYEGVGKDGFGYDPIFIPDGHNRTFGEMSGDEKGEISHRGKAMRKLIDYISGYIRCKNPE